MKLDIQYTIDILQSAKEIFKRNAGSCKSKSEAAAICGVFEDAIEAVRLKHEYGWHDLRKNPEDLPETKYGFSDCDGFDEDMNPINPWSCYESDYVLVYGTVLEYATRENNSGYFVAAYCEWKSEEDGTNVTKPQFETKEGTRINIDELIAWREIEPFEGA